MAFLFIWLFLGLLLLGAPMFYLMLAAPGIAVVVEGKSIFLNLLMQRLYSGIDSFPLMALPFFILAGELMTAGGVTRRMADFANSFVGHLRGGLAHVAVCSSVMLAGGCGSAVADASALGSLLIPSMKEQGYSGKYASAVIAASSVIVSIIPPSGLFILYAFIMNQSIAAMFAGGIIPGLLIAAGLMITIAIRAPGQNLPVSGKSPTLKEVIRTGKRAFFPLLTPVILIGGIVGGVFTPTEAAAIAATYSLILGVFYTKEIRWQDLSKIFAKTALSSAVILMLVGAAVAFASIISLKGTPQLVTQMVLTLTDNVYLMFFIVNVLLLGVGCLVDAGPAILMLAPILAPMMTEMGVHPIHFGLVMSINMIIGLITPPMGLVLFVVSGISREKVEAIAKEMFPLFASEVAVLFIITYFPETCLFIPRLMGYIS